MSTLKAFPCMKSDRGKTRPNCPAVALNTPIMMKTRIKGDSSSNPSDQMFSLEWIRTFLFYIYRLDK